MNRLESLFFAHHLIFLIVFILILLAAPAHLLELVDPAPKCPNIRTMQDVHRRVRESIVDIEFAVVQVVILCVVYALSSAEVKDAQVSTVHDA